MKKILMLLIIFIFMLSMVACNVLKGDIDGNVQLNGENLNTETAGNVIITTPNPTNNLTPSASPKPSETSNTLNPTISITPIITSTPVVTKTPTETTMPTISPTIIPTEKPTDNREDTDDKILSGMKICIDAGHQLKGNSEKERCAPWNDVMKAKCTSGTTGNYSGIEEYVMNLEISLKIRDVLEAYGAEVLMVRETHNVNISNKERAEMANEFDADVTLRIHGNSCDTPSVNGIELFVRDMGDGTSSYKAKSDADYKIASEMINFICDETGAKSRGVKRSDAYTGINWCENTCIIIECGFMSNEKEDKLMNSDEYQQKIANGIKNYFISSVS